MAKRRILHSALAVAAVRISVIAIDDPDNPSSQSVCEYKMNAVLCQCR